MSDAVRFEVDGAVGVITLARPDNHNRMTGELLDAFASAVAAARARRELRAVVITGTGTAFCAGADLNATLQRQELVGALASQRSYAMYEPFLSVLDLDVPVIGALNGHAVGGGFGLALLCDLRVAADAAKYGANFVKLGLAPGLAISYLLPRLIGVARAGELLYTGRLVDGREAAAIGLVNRCAAAADVMPTALALAGDIAAAAPIAVRATKTAIGRGLAWTVREAAMAEAFAQAETVATDDAREGIAAMLDKRPPTFRGR
jgi:enoyl-CoA hydratase/carnithine racemase